MIVEQLDMATFGGAHPTNREFVAQLEAWGCHRRRVDGVHLVFRGPHGGTLRVLRSMTGRADPAQVEKAVRLLGTDAQRFWAGPAAEPVPNSPTRAAAPVATSAQPAAKPPAVTGPIVTRDRPLGFEQVAKLSGGTVTREQVRHASSVLCREGHLHRVRSGVYQWAGGVLARGAAAAAPAREDVLQLVAPPVPELPEAAPPLRAAELFDQLFPNGVRMTAEVLADFEQWARLTNKLAGYAAAS